MSSEEIDVTCRDHVEHVLANYPDARGNRLLLQFLVYDLFHGLALTENQWNVIEGSDLPQPETIRRTAAKIQNDEGRWQAKTWT